MGFSRGRRLARARKPLSVGPAHPLPQSRAAKGLAVPEHPAEAPQSIDMATHVCADGSLTDRDRKVCCKVVRRLHQRPADRKGAPRIPELVAELEVQAARTPVDGVA